MNFLAPLFILPILTGPCFILAGLLLKKFPPESINSIYGYRTKSSMSSQERWDFAQQFAAKELIVWGIFLTAMSLSGLLIEMNETTALFITIGVLVICTVTPIIRTERKLKSIFGRE